jgi:hypothetical protein
MRTLCPATPTVYSDCLPPSPSSPFVVSSAPSPSSPFVVLPLHLRCLAPVIDVSPCCCCLALSLSPSSLSIPIGGDVTDSTRSTLRVKTRSGGGRVLGRRHSYRLLPTSSLTTCPPRKLGLAAVGGIAPVPLAHDHSTRSTPRAVARGGGGVCCHRWCHSTRDPPHEQLLVRLEAAGGSSWCPGTIQRRRRVVTRYRPSGQSCTGTEAGGRWSIVVVRCRGAYDGCFGGLWISVTWHGFEGV